MNQNYKAKIVCGKCQNENMTLTANRFEGTLDLICECTKCGRKVRYYAQQRFTIAADTTSFLERD